MDLNELFYRHQLALMNVSRSGSPITVAEAARSASNFALKIESHRSGRTVPKAVLSVRTLLELSAGQR